MVIPVIEEQWQVEKNMVETGKVLISKQVREENVQVDVPLASEEVDVQRVPVNQYLDTPPPAVRYDGDTMIVPVLREEIVVQKRLVLVEELRITKRRVQKQESQQVTLRREEVKIDRIPAGDSNPNPAG